MMTNCAKNNLRRYIMTKIDMLPPYREKKKAAQGAYKLNDLL
jgi:hypothetical protein